MDYISKIFRYFYRENSKKWKLASSIFLDENRFVYNSDFIGVVRMKKDIVVYTYTGEYIGRCPCQSVSVFFDRVFIVNELEIQEIRVISGSIEIAYIGKITKRRNLWLIESDDVILSRSCIVVRRDGTYDLSYTMRSELPKESLTALIRVSSERNIILSAQTHRFVGYIPVGQAVYSVINPETGNMAVIVSNELRIWKDNKCLEFLQSEKIPEQVVDLFATGAKIIVVCTSRVLIYAQ